MSGVVKAIGSVFKKIISSPIFKVVAIAVAVYFTGGLALGAMGSAFAASLPGIAGAADAIGLGATGAFATVGLDAAAATTAVSGLATGAMDAGITDIGSGAITDAATTGAMDAGATGIGSGAITDAGTSAADAATAAATNATPAIDASADGTVPGADATMPGADPGAPGAPTASPGAPVPDASAPAPGTPGSAPGPATPPSTTTAPSAPTSSQPGAFDQTGSQGIGSPPDQSGTMKSVTDWIKENPTMAQVLGKSAAQLGSSAVSAISQNATLSQQQEQYNQNRADAISRGTVPNETGSATWTPQKYKTPGVVNAALNAKPPGG